jgi:hypothetical protein
MSSDPTQNKTRGAERVERIVNLSASIVALWPLVVATIGGIGAAIWGHLDSLSSPALLLIGIGTGVGILWGVNGVIWLLREIRPSKERIAFDCAYGLALESISLGKDEGQATAAVQLGIVLRNASPVPLRYDVEEIEVIIGTTTIPHPAWANRGGLISRGCVQTFSYPSFPSSVIKPREKAVMRFTIAYGHPEFGAVRRMKKQLDVSLRLDDRAGAIYVIVAESDEAISPK